MFNFVQKFFKQFKKQSLTNKIVHKLSLKAVKLFIKKKEHVIEIYDRHGFFSEIEAIHLSVNRIGDLPKKTDIILLHNLTIDNFSAIISKLKQYRVNKLIILQHNHKSFDYWLMKLAFKLGLTKDNPSNNFFNLNFSKAILEKNNFIITDIIGSVFIPKMVLIFLPHSMQLIFAKFQENLDLFLSNSWFKYYLARNHIILCRKFSNCSKKRIDSVYISTALGFDNKYNHKTWVGKMYFRNINKLMDFLNIQKKEKILDIGCGTGNYSIEAAKLGALVTGIDLSSEMLKIAKEKAINAGLNIKFMKMDAENMLFSSDYFDKIVTASVPHVVENIDIFLMEISRVLKPGGYAVIHIVNPYSVAGIETIIEKTFHIHPPIRIITPLQLRTKAKKYGLMYDKTLGIEFHQGLPIPWKWRWKFIKKISYFENKLGYSFLNIIAAQQYIRFIKE